MDDEPMWAADRVVALTPSSAITIPETANEFAIKGYMLLVTMFNDEILQEDFDALLDEEAKSHHIHRGTILEEEILSEFDKFIIKLLYYDYENYYS
ncbi:hypothetical protein Tco_0686508 [Tanacetum coccineum]